MDNLSIIRLLCHVGLSSTEQIQGFPKNAVTESRGLRIKAWIMSFLLGYLLKVEQESAIHSNFVTFCNLRRRFETLQSRFKIGYFKDRVEMLMSRVKELNDLEFLVQKLSELITHPDHSNDTHLIKGVEALQNEIKKISGDISTFCMIQQRFEDLKNYKAPTDLSHQLKELYSLRSQLEILSGSITQPHLSNCSQIAKGAKILKSEINKLCCDIIWLWCQNGFK